MTPIPEAVVEREDRPVRIETPVLYPSHKEVWPPEVWEEMEEIRKEGRL